MFSGNAAGKEQAEFNKNAKKTIAVVSDVMKEVTKERYRINGNIRHRTRTSYIAYLDYEVNGVKYSNVKLDSVSASLLEGQSVVIYYNSKNPRDIALKLADSGSVRTSVSLVGLVFLAPGLWLIIKSVREIQNS